MSHIPPTRRDYERTINEIVQSRREVQKLRDATQSDEHFSGALVLVSVPREDNVSVAWETFQSLPPLQQDSCVYTIGTDERMNCGSGAIL